MSQDFSFKRPDLNEVIEAFERIRRGTHEIAVLVEVAQVAQKMEVSPTVDDLIDAMDRLAASRSEKERRTALVNAAAILHRLIIEADLVEQG